eukprot:CAMPEP_0167806968 /NCGR_PEP_ID=MMETSP0111_2-20121227/22208_1 /TAXON_ID=91324 /ORGANISM="Lotharella globosa, Strain CCCM811" /LENGTH=52 /DNA_ID=CAMNT_0007704651 /DNA_START=458 /DNA_END=612 /DNA_ORIENTATION=-
MNDAFSGVFKGGSDVFLSATRYPETLSAISTSCSSISGPLPSTHNGTVNSAG